MVSWVRDKEEANVYRGQASGLKAMGHSGSCRCHIVGCYWCWDGRKAETAWGMPVTGWCGWLVTLGAAWPPGPATQGCP